MHKLHLIQLASLLQTKQANFNLQALLPQHQPSLTDHLATAGKALGGGLLGGVAGGAGSFLAIRELLRRAASGGGLTPETAMIMLPLFTGIGVGAGGVGGAMGARHIGGSTA